MGVVLWRRVVLSSVVCLVLSYLSALSNCSKIYLKKVGHKMRVLIFCTNFVWNISHCKDNWATCYHSCTEVFKERTRYSCHIVMKLELSRHIFKKYLDIKYRENSSSGSRVVPCWQTDRQTDRHAKANSHFFAILWMQETSTTNSSSMWKRRWKHRNEMVKNLHTCTSITLQENVS
jgi:hypothetical protein